MTDFFGIVLSFLAWLLFKAFGIILFPWSIFIAIKEKRLGRYFYEIARGWDILANKAYEPALKKLGPGFGQDETISQRMAFNKRFGLDTDEARKWEKRINYFDKNHLEKTNFLN